MKSNGRGRCKRQAIAGGSVCPVHGGSAPQVKKKAQARLLALVDPALAVVLFDLQNKKEPALARRASEDVLD
jgi:hypothetical protein